MKWSSFWQTQLLHNTSSALAIATKLMPAETELSVEHVVDNIREGHVQSVTVLAQLHIWHKSHTLPGSSVCTVACLLCYCLVAYLAQVTHLAGKFHLHCCLFAPPLPDPLPIRTSPAPPASSLLFSFSSFLVFRLVHQSKSQVSSQVRSRLPNQLGSSSALPLPCHTIPENLLKPKCCNCQGSYPAWASTCPVHQEAAKRARCCSLYCTVLSEYRIRARGGRWVGSRRRGVSRSVKGFGGTWWW